MGSSSACPDHLCASFPGVLDAMPRQGKAATTAPQPDEVTKPTSVEQVAEAIRRATGIAIGGETTPLQALQREQAKAKVRKKILKKNIRTEEQKQHRLMIQALPLPTNDLLACFRERFEDPSKRAGPTATGLAADPGPAGKSHPQEQYVPTKELKHAVARTTAGTEVCGTRRKASSDKHLSFQSGTKEETSSSGRLSPQRSS